MTLNSNSFISKTDLLERMYSNQFGLKAAMMELTLVAEMRGSAESGQTVRSSLEVIGVNSGYIMEGLAKLKKIEVNKILSGSLEIFYD